MRFRLQRRPFFSGLIWGLALLATLGATVRPQHLYDQFLRFHPFMSIESSFFPTAREIEQLVHAGDDQDRSVYVVVGGSSVLHGVGQAASLVWTRRLQEELGPKFRVINLAQRAGAPLEFGNVGAELLIKQGRPVIFVADGRSDTFGGYLEHGKYVRVLFEGWLRNDLLPWPARDRFLSSAFFSPIEAFRRDAWGAAFDRVLNYNDLWSWLTFEHVGTLWNAFLVNESFRARRLFHDPELSPDAIKASPRPDLHSAVLKLFRHSLRPLDSSYWDTVEHLLKTTMPSQLRHVTLAVLDLNDPDSMRELTDEERRLYRAQVVGWGARLKQLGFHDVSTDMIGFEPEDFIDTVHMSVQGGEKLAVALAPKIKTMANELGYLR